MNGILSLLNRIKDKLDKYATVAYHTMSTQKEETPPMEYIKENRISRYEGGEDRDTRWKRRRFIQKNIPNNREEENKKAQENTSQWGVEV